MKINNDAFGILDTMDVFFKNENVDECEVILTESLYRYVDDMFRFLPKVKHLHIIELTKYEETEVVDCAIFIKVGSSPKKIVKTIY